MTLNPLAAPKGVKLSCEMCQKPAHVQCTECRVACYCCEGHRDEDWAAIHEKVCPLVAALASPQPHTSTHEERILRAQQQEMRKRHIVGVSLQEGRRLVVSGQPALAIPAAMQAVKYLTELRRGGGGGGVVDLVPAYLILSEAAIQLGRLLDAEQYLSQVQWTTLQSADMPSYLLSSLHRNLGNLAIARGNYKDARSHFAEDIYQASLSGGTASTLAAGGYLKLSQVFMAEARDDIAASLQTQVVICWLGYLNDIYTAPKPSISPETIAEVAHTLSFICDLQERRAAHHSSHPHSSPLHLIPTYHAIAVLNLVHGEKEKAKVKIQQALHLTPTDHPHQPTLQALMDTLSVNV